MKGVAYIEDFGQKVGETQRQVHLLPPGSPNGSSGQPQSMCSACAVASVVTPAIFLAMCLCVASGAAAE